jgi:glycosyltransferase involved in cell wall biosynthesis
MDVKMQFKDTYPRQSEDPRMAGLQVVVPIFNDWASFYILLRELDQVFAKTRRVFSVIAVDDGSTDNPNECLDELGPVSALSRVRIVKLATNRPPACDCGRTIGCKRRFRSGYGHRYGWRRRRSP